MVGFCFFRFIAAGLEDFCLIFSIKDVVRPKNRGWIFNQLDLKEDDNSNGLLADFKKWGIKTNTRDMLDKQFQKIERITEIYEDGEE